MKICEKPLHFSLTYDIILEYCYEYMLGRKGFLPAMRYVDNYIIGKESIELCVESLDM